MGDITIGLHVREDGSVSLLNQMADQLNTINQAAKDTYDILTGAATPASSEFLSALSNISTAAQSGAISVTEDAHAMAILGAAASNGITSVQGLADALRSVADVNLQQMGINMQLDSGGFQYGVDTNLSQNIPYSSGANSGQEDRVAHQNAGLAQAAGKAAPAGPATDPFAPALATARQLDQVGPKSIQDIKDAMEKAAVPTQQFAGHVSTANTQLSKANDLAGGVLQKVERLSSRVWQVRVNYTQSGSGNGAVG